MDMDIIDRIKVMYEDVQDYLSDARTMKDDEGKANKHFELAFEILQELHSLVKAHHGMNHPRYEDICV